MTDDPIYVHLALLVLYQKMVGLHVVVVAVDEFQYYSYFLRLSQGGRDESTPQKKTFRASKCTTVLVKPSTRWPFTPIFVTRPWTATESY